MSQQNGKPRVYSYTRFSSPEQAEGDSERRQIEAAKRYAEENDLVLDEELKFIDRGRSGYKGTHRKGDFGAFLELVKTGQVAPGSTLLVENIDRLSRENLSTQLKTIFFDLLERGICIVTLSPRDTFTMKSVEDGGIWRLLAYMMMGHAESKKKAERLGAAWANKKRNAARVALTSRAPAWLKVTTKKEHNRIVSSEVSVIAEAAETIKLIFDLRVEGYGRRAIEKKLNATASWFPPKNPKRKTTGWRDSYIQKILRTRAVLGEFQPHKWADGKRVPDGEPIRGYFPAIISEDLFNAVQQKASALKGKGGKTGKADNVLRHLARCGYCGGVMTFQNKGYGVRLICDNRRRAVQEGGKLKCDSKPVSYFEVEQTVLENCRKLNAELVLPNSGEQAEELKRLQTRIEGLRVEMSAVTAQKKGIVDKLGLLTNAEMVAMAQKNFEALSGKQTELETALRDAEQTLRGLERGRESFEEWQRNLDGLSAAIRKDPDCRIKLNGVLKQLIAKIEIFAGGHYVNVERAEDIMEEFNPELVRAKSYPEFRRYLERRLVSPDGRFFQLHLRRPIRPPAVADAKGRKPLLPEYKGTPIAPKESLAYRVEIRAKELTFSGPNVAQLAGEFFDGRKSGWVPKKLMESYARAS